MSNLSIFFFILLLTILLFYGCTKNGEKNLIKNKEKNESEEKNESKKIKRIFPKEDEINKNAKNKELENSIFCITLYDPVCGEDNITYSNECFARANKTKVKHKGKCV